MIQQVGFALEKFKRLDMTRGRIDAHTRDFLKQGLDNNVENANRAYRQYMICMGCTDLM